MNGLSNFDKTYREYSLSATDDLIGFWTSKAKVPAGRRMHPHRRWGGEAHLLFSPHGIAMPKGLYFAAVVFLLFFGTPNL